MFYLRLFFEFSKISLLAVGGGFATLPFLYKLAESQLNIFSAKDIPAMLAVAQIVPGPIGINLAAYCGLNAGTGAAYLAVFAMMLPQVLVITGIARSIDRFQNNAYVKRIFGVLNPAAAGLLASVAGSLIIPLVIYNEHKSSAFFSALPYNFFCAILIIIFTFMLCFFKKIPIVFFIIAAGILGIIFKM